jgi:putative acetyltransferase
MLQHLLARARAAGHHTIWLETGTQDFFAPARRLYARHGFTPCEPFGGYRHDPNSAFMTLANRAPV